MDTESKFGKERVHRSSAPSAATYTLHSRRPPIHSQPHCVELVSPGTTSAGGGRGQRAYRHSVASVYRTEPTPQTPSPTPQPGMPRVALRWAHWLVPPPNSSTPMCVRR